jgi:hypothetical protein
MKPKYFVTKEIYSLIIETENDSLTNGIAIGSKYFFELTNSLMGHEQ